MLANRLSQVADRPVRKELPLVYTVGEPAGIGVDLAVELSNHDWRQRVVALSCPELLRRRARDMGKTLRCLPYPSGDEESDRERARLKVGELWVHPNPCPHLPEPGIARTDNAEWVLSNLRQARAGIREGRYDALTTGPIDKSVMMRAGYQFSGHTEYLAQLGGASITPVMLMASPTLRVAMVVTHTPMERLASTLVEAVRSGAFATKVRILADSLKDYYNIARPRIAVCGLNPHAGESGLLGTEENEWIIPALDELRSDPSICAELDGPMPGDSAFIPDKRAVYDAYLSMYHDQGLVAVKTLAFGTIVNTTLGLDIVRTSVDHGVAYDKAGKGQANPAGMFLAIAEAARLAATLRAVKAAGASMA